VDKGHGDQLSSFLAMFVHYTGLERGKKSAGGGSYVDKGLGDRLF
jgi:hypothetical protein